MDSADTRWWLRELALVYSHTVGVSHFDHKGHCRVWHIASWENRPNNKSRPRKESRKSTMQKAIDILNASDAPLDVKLRAFQQASEYAALGIEAIGDKAAGLDLALLGDLMAALLPILLSGDGLDFGQILAVILPILLGIIQGD